MIDTNSKSQPVAVAKAVRRTLLDNLVDSTDAYTSIEGTMSLGTQKLLLHGVYSNAVRGD